MIWFIIAGIVAGGIIIASAIGYSKDEYLGFWGKVGSTAFVAFITLLLGFLLANFVTLAVGALVYSNWDEVDYTETKTIVLMSDNIEAKGEWSLFGGSLASEGKFYFYVEDEGVITLDSTEAEDSSIMEDSASPYLEVIHYSEELKLWGETWPQDTEYIFHIPEGSINHSIKLDGE